MVNSAAIKIGLQASFSIMISPGLLGHIVVLFLVFFFFPKKNNVVYNVYNVYNNL